MRFDYGQFTAECKYRYEKNPNINSITEIIGKEFEKMDYRLRQVEEAIRVLDTRSRKQPRKKD